MSRLTFHRDFIFRTPVYSFNAIASSTAELKKIAAHTGFREAIYLSSPVLNDEINRWLGDGLDEEKEIAKLIVSLHKYLSRMSSRCTPYGLFASCSVGQWGDKNEIVLGKNLHRHTRLDMDFVCALARSLAQQKDIRQCLQFFPNTSLYKTGDNFRYMECLLNESGRHYQITGVETSDYLEKIFALAQTGARIDQLAQALVNHEVAREEAEIFIHELIDAQLLVGELEPAVTGDEFIHRLLAILKRLRDAQQHTSVDVIIACLERIHAILAGLDENKENDPALYRKLLDEIAALPVKAEENRLFQVDAFREPEKATLDKTIREKLLQAGEFLQKLCGNYYNPELEGFKSRFYERYESREIPLLEVLDTETGIGYPAKDHSGVNELVDDLYVPGPAMQNITSVNWNPIEELLLNKLIDAAKNEKHIVSFSLEEIESVALPEGNYGPTVGIMARIIDASKNKLFLNGIGGLASAAALPGRFAHGDEKIQQIIDDITSFEENAMKEKALAEVVHITESRMGNILLRPVFREYEIPYLAASALPPEGQLPPADLLVSLRDNRIVLRSRRLNKEVVPRLSSAHNYTSNALPLYRFLCDLQMQDIEKPGLSFGWGSLAKMFRFLPRAEFGDVVLFPATWNLSAQDWAPLSDNISAIGEWKTRWKMPRYVLLKDIDNELLVDFENELSVQAFLHTIKKRPSITLIEFLFDPAHALVKDEEGNVYTNEVIAIAFNEDYKAPAAAIPAAKKMEEDAGETQRSFLPGSEWLYYKIYCGVKTADQLLVSMIAPLTSQLAALGLVDNWFFVRFNDPDPHLRLRFHVHDPAGLAQVIPFVSGAFEKLKEQGVLSKIMLETYTRELERYGGPNIALSERGFGIDSRVTIRVLEAAKIAGEELKWQYAIKSVDALLDDFGFPIAQKLELMEALSTRFTNEHSAHKSLKVQLDQKYRKMRPELQQIFSNSFPSEKNGAFIMNLLQARREELQPVVDELLLLSAKDQLSVNLDDLLASWLHMSLNRLFKSKQRTHEMVIYDQLYRHYKSQLARSKVKTLQQE